MADHLFHQARRRFLKLAVAGAASLPAWTLLAGRPRAQEEVDPGDELAQDLGYVEDASAVDPSEWPTYEEGQVCANCALYHGAEGEEYGPCDIFNGNLVAAQGWCSSWIAREA
jgi:hypothetical protein